MSHAVLHMLVAFLSIINDKGQMINKSDLLLMKVVNSKVALNVSAIN